MYAGLDPVSGTQHYLREIIKPGPKAEVEAQKALRRLATQVDKRRNPRTSATLDQLLDRYLETLSVAPSTHRTYVRYLEKHVRPFLGRSKAAAVDVEALDSLYAELRRCQKHCVGRKAGTDHRTPREHVCDERCRPHRCQPLAPATIQHIHFVLHGAFDRAVRWRWVVINPVELASAPAKGPPEPNPPSPAEATRLLDEAWTDPDWGTLVWLTMTTGARRGELCALRWSHVDLENGVLSIRRAIIQFGGKLQEKDTKTHQQRRVTLDPETVAVLAEHFERATERAASVGAALLPDAFVFSNAPDCRAPLVPGSVSQRYSRMADRLGIETHLHALRHYSATELISAGVDVRTVAGRLGHSGGGNTTLRVYAAWVAESDQRAARGLVSRLPQRPAVRTAAERALEQPRTPRERLAVHLREQIVSGQVQAGDHLPGIKQLAAEHGLAFSTVHRSFELLREWGLLAGAPGERPIVVVPARLEATAPVPPAVAVPGEREKPPDLVEFELRHLGVPLSRFAMAADHNDGAVLDKVLRKAVRRSGLAEPVDEFELVVLRPGEAEQIFAVLE